jgi:hypothetical protein
MDTKSGGKEEEHEGCFTHVMLYIHRAVCTHAWTLIGRLRLRFESPVTRTLGRWRIFTKRICEASGLDFGSLPE